MIQLKVRVGEIRVREQPLMQPIPDTRQLHRQLRGRHSRVRQCLAIEATCESRYVQHGGESSKGD